MSINNDTTVGTRGLLSHREEFPIIFPGSWGTMKFQQDAHAGTRRDPSVTALGEVPKGSLYAFLPQLPVVQNIQHFLTHIHSRTTCLLPRTSTKPTHTHVLTVTDTHFYKHTLPVSHIRALSRTPTHTITHTTHTNTLTNTKTHIITHITTYTQIQGHNHTYDNTHPHTHKHKDTHTTNANRRAHTITYTTHTYTLTNTRRHTQHTQTQGHTQSHTQ